MESDLQLNIFSALKLDLSIQLVFYDHHLNVSQQHSSIEYVIFSLSSSLYPLLFGTMKATSIYPVVRNLEVTCPHLPSFQP